MSEQWENLSKCWTFRGAKKLIKRGLFSSRGHNKYRIVNLEFDIVHLQYEKRCLSFRKEILGD
jgi:hypothetical protein